jgi:hypothetical protein
VKTVDVSVDGFRYRVTQLTGFAGFRMSNRLLRLMVDALPAVAKMAGGAKLSALLDQELDTLLPAVGAIIAKLTADEQEEITRELLAPVVVVLSGKQEPVLDVFDIHFQGRIASAYKLVFQTIKVNFGNFGVARDANGAARQTQTPASSETSTISAGQPSV